jgi:hypothetical protein
LEATQLRRRCQSPRLHDWAAATLPNTGTAEHGYRRWLLIRRSITDPTELAYYLCYGPAGTHTQTNTSILITVTGVHPQACAKSGSRVTS